MPDLHDWEAEGQFPTRRELLQFEGRLGPYWYAEGHSGRVNELEGGGTWFCFEEPYEEAVKQLHLLGFTSDEIREAEERG